MNALSVVDDVEGDRRALVIRRASEADSATYTLLTRASDDVVRAVFEKPDLNLALNVFQGLLAEVALSQITAEDIDEEYNDSDSAEFQVHVMDVGKGNAVLVEGPEETMLVDAGTRAGSPVDYSQVRDFIRNDADVDTIDYAVISHNHTDHSSFMDEIIRDFGVERVYVQDYPGPDDEDTSIPAVEEAAADSGATIQLTTRGD